MSDFKSIGPLVAKAVQEAAEHSGRVNWTPPLFVSLPEDSTPPSPPQWMSNLAESVRDYIDPEIFE